MNSRDRLIERAIQQQAEIEKHPAYKMLISQFEEEQRNPGLRMAREEALRQSEEERRNPGLRIAREQLEQENRNPFLRIARERADEHQRTDALYRITSHSLREWDRFSIVERLRPWEKTLPDWVLNPKVNAGAGFETALVHLTQAERAAERFARLPGIGIQDVRLHNWDRFTAVSRELSVALLSLPPEINNTFLAQANKQLELIRESVERQDATTLDHAFDVFVDYVLSWIQSLGPKVLTSPAALGILVTVLIAAGQMALSYKWRLEDKKDADSRIQLQNEKLESVLKAVRERTAPPSAYAGKQYSIERTTRVFERPGARRAVTGYVYVGQLVRGTATTGRWIFVEYADRFSLEQRAGWIRKKYAKLDSNYLKINLSSGNDKLDFAVELYEKGQLSLGQAAKLARLSKPDFIDVLGNLQIPILNYPAEDLSEEIGV